MSYAFEPNDIVVHTGYETAVYPDIKLFQWDGLGDLARLNRAMQKLADPAVSAHRAFAELFADGSIAAYANRSGGHSGFPVESYAFWREIDIVPGDWVMIGQYSSYYGYLHKLTNTYVTSRITLTGTV